MSIQSSPLLGYNNNVRHKGKVFHIQTEDSGVKYGHIMTHLFTDGGRIVKSVKTSYAEYIGNERMADIVREMMKQQHKAIFIALRDGKFDTVGEASGDAPPSSRTFAFEAAAKPALPGSAEVKRAGPIPPSLPRAPRPDGQPTSPLAAPASDDAPVLTLREPEELMLDLDLLERTAATADGTSPVLRTPSDLPPPPANLLRDRAGTAAGSSSGVPPLPVRRPSSTANAATPTERRYAPTRPASIFGQARPQQGKSIFGEDLISDKSLDEAILSYLADDLDSQEK
jgi:hypothetical protein